MKLQITETETTIYVYITEKYSIIASSECSEISDEWFFNRLYVRPEYRGKGYGSKVLDKMLELVKKRNIILELAINPYGEMTYNELEAFYLHHGFKKSGIRYYFNKEG